MERLIIVTGPPKSFIVYRQIRVGDSKYVVISGPYTRSRDTAHTQRVYWPLTWAEEWFW